MTGTATLPEQGVLSEEWDVLIVLDAARYDIFAKLYEEYLDGDLSKQRSKGSATPEWAAKTFTGHHDVAYLSGNPFINSLGIPINEMEWGSSYDSTWTSTDHLAEIVDLWHDVWDDELGTVPPEATNRVVLDHIDLRNAHDRMVIHYMQPHAPYLIHGKGRKVGRIRKSFKEAKENGRGPAPGLLDPVWDRVKPTFERVLGQRELAMKLGMLVDLNAGSLVDVGRRGARTTLEDYYEQNLRLVLEAVANIIDELEGNIVVTADHGEAFGEHGVWEHQVETHIPPLIEVPWLRVD